MKARHVMQCVLCGFQATNYMVWTGLIGPLMVFVLEEYSAAWKQSQLAFLLGAFSLGYVPLQIPFSLLARRTGEKLLCTVNLCAQSVGCILIPAAAAAGPLWLSAVHAGLGLFQGSRIPCLAVLDGRWIPDGLERVRNQQLAGWFAQGYGLLVNFLVPMLSLRFGWRVIPRWFAVQSAIMAVVWHAWAANTPAEWRGPVEMDAAERHLLEDIGLRRSTDEKTTEADAHDGSKIHEQAVEEADNAAENPTDGEEVLRDKDLPPLSVVQLLKIRKIQGMLGLCVVQSLFPVSPAGALSTVYFSERYGMSMEKVLLTGTALSLPNQLVGSLGNGMVESILIKMGWSSIDVRRRSSSLGYIVEATLTLLYVWAPTANVGE
jgi:MFS family permease